MSAPLVFSLAHVFSSYESVVCVQAVRWDGCHARSPVADLSVEWFHHIWLLVGGCAKMLTALAGQIINYPTLF